MVDHVRLRLSRSSRSHAKHPIIGQCHVSERIDLPLRWLARREGDKIGVASLKMIPNLPSHISHQLGTHSKSFLKSPSGARLFFSRNVKIACLASSSQLHCPRQIARECNARAFRRRSTMILWLLRFNPQKNALPYPVHFQHTHASHKILG